MSEPKKPSGKKTVKKRIVKKIIKKKKTGTSEAGDPSGKAVKAPSEIAKPDKSKPRRRIIKRRAATRKFSKAALEEVLGKKLDKKTPSDKKDDIETVKKPEKAAPDEKPAKEVKKPSSGERPRKIRRRVVKKRPAIKKVIKKKAVTRRLARETVEQVLGKKMAAKKEEKTPKSKKKEPASKKIVIPKKSQELAQKKEYATKEIPRPEIVTPKVVIPDNWKEKKISSYEKKPERSPFYPDLPKDTILNDRYKVWDCIHSDCYGGVYKVKDQEKGNKAFSIKEIQCILSKGEHQSTLDDTVNSLNKITSFLQDVDHPNLTKIYDCFFHVDKQGARFFIVMEFVEGKSLEEELKESSKDERLISAKSISNYMGKICDALSYLHNKKPFPIAFGDLKPSNIMVSSDGDIKCINYGMARVGNILSQYKGTLGYSAPEQSGVDFTNTKADIFAFGATIYYLLSGINPEKNPYEFKSIKDTKPFISNKVEELVFRCINIHPDDRPSIEDVKKVIRGFDFFELDTSAKVSKKEDSPEEKKKEIKPPKAAVVELVEEVIGDDEEEEKVPFHKTIAFKIIGAIVAIILIVVVVLSQQ